MFEENRSLTRPRREIIAANPGLRDRAEAKTASLPLLLAGELEKRDVKAPLAMLAARIGMAAFGYAV